MKQIKILNIGMSYRAGGIEKFLLNYQKEIDCKKIRLDYVNVFDNVSNESFYKTLSENSKIINLPNYRKHPFRFIKEFKKLNDIESYDILHYHMNSAVYLWPLIAAKFSKVRIIIAHAHNTSSDKGFLKKAIHMINKRLISIFANQYFACSKKAGIYFFNNKILNSNNFHIINNAIEIKKYQFNHDMRTKIRRELNISDKDIVFGNVARLTPQKNYNFLIDLFNEYHKKNHNSFLIIIGQGILKEKLENKVIKLKLENCIYFLGEKDNVEDYLSAMDIFIFPSLYEGLGISLIEAQASGLPCIASTQVPSETKVSNLITYVSLKENISNWINKIDLALKQSNSRKIEFDVIKEYDISVCAKKLETLYMKLNQIRICHFVNGIVNGGVENVILNYFKYIDRNDYELHIISQGKSDMQCFNKFEQLGFKIHIVTRKKVSILKNYIEINKILKENRFDIVHAHMTSTNCFPLFYSWLSGIKIRINHSHNAKKMTKITTKVMCKLAEKFTTHKMACSIEAAKCLFGTENNVIILNNAVEIDRFVYDINVREKKRKEFNFSSEDIVIGNVGRFVEQKNHYFIIRIFNEIYKRNQSYKLILVGIGELEKNIKDMINDLECRNNVLFLGTRKDIAEIYQVMDIFILPSLYEGLGISAIEAQISGLKCICSTNITSEVKICNNLEFIDLNEQKWIEEILKIKNYNRKSEVINATIHGFNIKEEAPKLDHFYKSILWKG